MRRSGKGSGGGAGMNKNVRPEVRIGKGAQGKRHEAVSQIGQSMGNHSTGSGKIHKSAVERVEGPRPVSAGVMLGNENAKQLSGANCGVGKGRVILRSGGQGQHGPSAPGSAPAKNTDILRQFGPDVPGRK